ncbi:hypothetical protein DPMN_186232 [Dreissena polymorpha]|uniref:Uncharacterized protein n=1 Tax=Dreissena polymorpha TaxID=45954 RepID=A0A9D4DMB2_DREPO|nr:hypothetical protein DPMN_186232 [Dreissena polymorpha]
MSIIDLPSRPQYDVVFARNRRASSAGRPTHLSIGKLRYARGGRFSATAARTPSYIRQVAARLRLKDSAVLAAHVKALRIEGTEAVSD